MLDSLGRSDMHTPLLAPPFLFVQLATLATGGRRNAALSAGPSTFTPDNSDGSLR
jgi:hypothetical protein